MTAENLGDFGMLPVVIRDRIFLYFGTGRDFKTLERTRELQSPYIRQLTQFNNISRDARFGNLDNIKWLREMGHNWKKNTLGNAALFGDLDIIKWLYANGCNDIKFQEYQSCAQNMAIKGCKIDILNWMLENNFAFYHTAIGMCLSTGNIDIIKWMLNTDFYLLERIIPLQYYTVKYVVNSCKLEIIEYLHECGILLDDLLNKAIEYNKFNIMKWAIKHGYSYSNRSFRLAAECSNIDHMIWLLDNGCIWYKNHLDVFTFSKEVETWINVNLYNSDKYLKNSHLNFITFAT